MHARFLRQLTLYLAPFVGFWVWFELSLASVPRTYALKRAILDDLPNDATIVLGSSHELNGVLPEELFDRSFNLANGNQSLHYDALLLRAAVGRTPRLRRVLLGVGYHSVGGNLCASGDGWRCSEYYREFGFEGEPGWDWFALTNFCGLAICTPEQSRAMFVAKMTGRELGQPRPDGFIALRGQVSSGDVERARRRVRQHELPMSKDNERRNLRELSEAVSSARSGGTAVYVIVTPVMSSYFEAIAERSRGHFLSTLHAWAGRAGVPVLDHWQNAAFETSDFANDDHLNERGARKYSRILRREIESLERMRTRGPASRGAGGGP